MILAKTNPVGLDVVVHRIQKDIHKAFDVKWSVGGNTDKGIICFPRCYVNFKDSNKFKEYNDKIIEYFDSSTTDDYEDILDSESNKMIVLHTHDIDDLSDVNGKNFKTTYLELIFIVDLSVAYPNITHRADEEARSEVTKIVEKIQNCKVYRIVRGLNKVFGDIKYPSSLDLHPSHCFKIVLKVERFSENEKICN